MNLIRFNLLFLFVYRLCGMCLVTAGWCYPVANAQNPPSLAPLDTSDRIGYFIAAGMAESQFQAADRDLATWALQAWERSSNGALRLEPDTESSALLRVYWVPASFGLYGEMQPLVVAGRRGAAVFIRPDTDAFGEQIAQRSREDPLFRDTVVYLTCLHELGHALGLTHTSDFADVMYFFGFGGDLSRFFGRYRDQLRSRDDIADVAGLSAGDLRQLGVLYGLR